MAGVVMEAGGKVAYLPLQFRHFGYLSREAVGREKMRRNVEIIRKSLKENPDDSFMRFNLGLEYLRLRNFQGALEEFVRSFRTLPSIWAGYGHMLVRNIAVCLYYLDRHEELRQVVREAQGVYLGYTDLTFLEALSFMSQHRFREAEEGFLRCLEMGESPPEYMTEAGVGSYKALAGLGEAREAQGDLEGAVRYYLRAVEQKPSYLIPLRRLSALLLREGDPVRASQVLARTPALYSPEASLELSAIFLRAGRAEEAAFWAERARMMGAGEKARMQAARALAFQGRKEEAVSAYLEVADEELRPRALSEAGLFLCLLGREEEARKAWDQVEETEWREGWELLAQALREGRSGRRLVSPLAERAVWEGLELLLRSGEFEAFERALGALESLPLSPAEAELRLGHLYFSAGFPDMAHESWARALEKGVYDRESLAFLGEKCLEEGQLEEAVTILAGALALDPENEKVYISLTRALALSGREEEAREVLEAGKARFPGADRLLAAGEALEVLAAARRG
jgi:tetratricopeptide (TPR) repeat protein